MMDIQNNPKPHVFGLKNENSKAGRCEAKFDNQFEPGKKDAESPNVNIFKNQVNIQMEAKFEDETFWRLFQKLDEFYPILVEPSESSRLCSDQLDLLKIRNFRDTNYFLTETEDPAVWDIQEVYFGEMPCLESPTISGKFGPLIFPQSMTEMMKLAVGDTKVCQLLSSIVKRMLKTQTLEMTVEDYREIVQVLTQICMGMKLATAFCPDHLHITAQTDVRKKDVIMKHDFDAVQRKGCQCDTEINYVFTGLRRLAVMCYDGKESSGNIAFSKLSDSFVSVSFNKPSSKPRDGPWRLKKVYATDWSWNKDKEKASSASLDANYDQGPDMVDPQTVTYAISVLELEGKIAVLLLQCTVREYFDALPQGDRQGVSVFQDQQRDGSGSSKGSSCFHSNIDKRPSEQPVHRQADPDPDWKPTGKEAGPREPRQNNRNAGMQGSTTEQLITIRIDDGTFLTKQSHHRHDSQTRNMAGHQYEVPRLSDKHKNVGDMQSVPDVPSSQGDVKKSYPSVSRKLTLDKLSASDPMRHKEKSTESAGKQHQTQTALDDGDRAGDRQEPTLDSPFHVDTVHCNENNSDSLKDRECRHGFMSETTRHQTGEIPDQTNRVGVSREYIESHRVEQQHSNEVDSDPSKDVDSLQSFVSESHLEGEITETKTTCVTNTISASAPQSEQEGNDGTPLAVDGEEALSVDETNVSSPDERTEQGAASRENTTDLKTPEVLKTSCKDRTIIEMSSDDETTSVKFVTPVQETDTGASGVFTECRDVSPDGSELECNSSLEVEFGFTDLPKKQSQLSMADVSTKNISKDGLKAANPLKDRAKAYGETDDDHNIHRDRHISCHTNVERPRSTSGHHPSLNNLTQSATFMFPGTASVQRPSALAEELSSTHHLGQPEAVSLSARQQGYGPPGTARDLELTPLFTRSGNQLHLVPTSRSEDQSHPVPAEPYLSRSETQLRFFRTSLENQLNPIPTSPYSTLSENQLYPSLPRRQLPPIVIHRAGDPPPWATKTPKVDISRAAHPDMVKVLTRRGTYWRKWPEDNGRDLNILSLAGFFYTGHGRGVRCWWCGLYLPDLRPDQDPWVEHALHSPHCQYLREMRSDEFFQQL